MRHFRPTLLVLVCWLLAGLPTYAHKASARKMVCPVCSTEFKSVVTMSSTLMGTLRDFEKTGAVGRMYEEGIASCPTCHYSWTPGEFGNPVPDDLKQWILETLKSRYPAGEIPKAEAYRVYAEIAARKHFDDFKLAGIFRLASYVSRHAGESDQDRRALQGKVVQHLVAALAKHEVPQEQVAVTYYIIGEMDRRQAKFPEAVRWFEKAAKESGPGKAEFPEWNDWVKEQRAMAEKKDANNTI